MFLGGVILKTEKLIQLDSEKAFCLKWSDIVRYNKIEERGLYNSVKLDIYKQQSDRNILIYIMGYRLFSWKHKRQKCKNVVLKP